MKKVIIYILVFFIGIFLFVRYDYNRYFVGKSLINYKKLPFNIRPSEIDYFYGPDNTRDEFYLIYNGYEYFGYGSAVNYFVNDFNLLKNGCKEYEIDTIIGYYYNDRLIFILCRTTDGNKILVTPKLVNGDLIFCKIRSPNKDVLKKMTYVLTILN